MRRVMIKISGEALCGKKAFGFDDEFIDDIINQIKLATNNEICILVGGGNFLRGRDLKHIDQVKADQIGMLSTVMNAICLSDFIERLYIS